MESTNTATKDKKEREIKQKRLNVRRRSEINGCYKKKKKAAT